MGPLKWTTFLFAAAAITCGGVSGDFLMGGHLDNKNGQEMMEKRMDDTDLMAEESSASATSYPDGEARYKIPYAFAFNGGVPFSLEKDPITGEIDLEKAPPLKALNISEIYQDDDEESSDDSATESAAARNDEDSSNDDYGGAYGKFGYHDGKRKGVDRLGPNEINPYSPSFHDFLNLPVKYSSDKYQQRQDYPLISSSYANTKVQSGSNSYNINNHRPTYHQETAIRVSTSTPSRRIYYPKSTTTTTTTTTMKPRTTPTTTSTTTTSTTTTMRPTTTSTTTTTTTPKPVEIIKKYTSPKLVRLTKATTPMPPPTPRVTTWKPPKTNANRYDVDEYDEMLPIEKLQGTGFSGDSMGHYPMMVNNGHNSGPQSPPRMTTTTTTAAPAAYDSYDDGYDDYELSSHEEQADSNNSHNRYQAAETTLSSSTSTTATSDSSSTAAPTTMSDESEETVPPTTTPPISDDSSTVIHLTTAKTTASVSTPVTSMPIDVPHIPPVHENFVEINNRPVVSNVVDFYHHGKNPSSVVQAPPPPPPALHGAMRYPPPPPPPHSPYTRPGSVISVLPESTSNVIVPHDQDTVSFVLGNRQNVEGSYYTHGSAVEERPYPVNEASFRPIYGSMSVSVIQQPAPDQKVSVSLSSVAVVEPSSAYTPQKWYNNNNEQDTQQQPPAGMVKAGFVSDAEPPKPHRQGPYNINQNNKDDQMDSSLQNDEVQVSSVVTFPHRIQDKKDDQVSEPNVNSNRDQRPVEEHVIVINQADGSVKEIEQGNNQQQQNQPQQQQPEVEGVFVTGSVSGNAPNLNVNNNPQPKLPQLTDMLTPPMMDRPPMNRPPTGAPNQRPPHYFHYQHGGGPTSGPSSSTPMRPPQRLPMPPRKPEPVMPTVGFKRRPGSTQDPKLPNVLPHFRPNAKTSHGHRGAEKIGTIPAAQSYLNGRPPRPPVHGQSPPPHFHPGVLGAAPSSQRRTHLPPQPPHQQPMNSPAPPSHFQRPPPLPLPQALQRKKEDNTVGTMPAPASALLPPQARPQHGAHQQQQKHRMEDELANAERFPVEPPQISPRPIVFIKNRSDGHMPKVATLQMIQQRGGGLDDDLIRSNLPPLFKVKSGSSSSDDETDDRNENSTLNNETDRKDNDVNNNAGADQVGPVYVVYPVNSAVNIGSQEDDRDGDDDSAGERDESVVIGTANGSQRPLPPVALPVPGQQSSSSSQQQDQDDIRRNEAADDASDRLTGLYYGIKKPDLGNGINYPEQQPFLRHEKPLLVPSDGRDDLELAPPIVHHPHPNHQQIYQLDREFEDQQQQQQQQAEQESSSGSSSDSSFNVISYLTDLLPFGKKTQPPPPPPPPTSTISATLPRLPPNKATSPIAFVYTPTTPASTRQRLDLSDDGSADGSYDPYNGIVSNHRPRDEKPVLLPFQQPSSSSSSAPSPQNFMAPFVASVSAEMPAKNGWSVQNIEKRTGNAESEDGSQETEAQTERTNAENNNSANTGGNPGSNSGFDPENFKPQLFGGFKPIYEFPANPSAGNEQQLTGRSGRSRMYK
ncbi:uncharacterized protein LOC106653579 [Trichogramma pretiosum]|uniref:uncharacterized protein LOC106653579 n=1 Tax=Trichogramma pretiosum TaxID=7493 RepID=UPI0006C9B5D3|nr:uncharacterized protein LOC106653579 [Trichogramma pretiosum]